ncbi:MAG: tRNA pseudouridine(55) synthase TruB [Candidatus Borkfalkiaceae bacterium]|nr:tRNA pseudouridine(55) synthase TruB [Christensenellaceae bacterium]
MNGFINVYKPKKMSSAFCLNKIKRKFGFKCGHMGTLDPLACGILPVGIGQATRLFDCLLDKKKVYVAEFTFGTETDTLDLEGKPVFTGGKIPSKAEIIDLLPHFCGNIQQVPPAFSAKCVDGKKSYKLARKGIAVELNPKEVTVYSIEVLSDDDGGEKNNNGIFRFKIECGGGTYIRSLARDIGRAAGSYATMTGLERVACGYFTKENSVTLQQIENAKDISELLIKSDEVLDFPKLYLDKAKATRLLNGLRDEYAENDGDYLVYAETENGENEFWGVGHISQKILIIKPYVRG